MTILELLAQRGLSPVKATNMHGGEYVSPCPKCGGSDCFRVWPALNAQDNESGIWFCRRCSQGGDLKKFLQVFGEISVDETEKKMAITPEERRVLRLYAEKCKDTPWASTFLVQITVQQLLALLGSLDTAEAERAMLHKRVGWLLTNAWVCPPEGKRVDCAVVLTGEKNPCRSCWMEASRRAAEEI